MLYLGGNCCGCVRLLRLGGGALGFLRTRGGFAAPLAMMALTACSQMESASMGLGSAELAAGQGALAYNAAPTGATTSSAGTVMASASPASTGGLVIRGAFPTTPAAAPPAGAPLASKAPLTRGLPLRLQESAPAAGGPYKIGAPYTVGGEVYVPKHERNYKQVGLASWYGSDFHGHETANGEVYDMHALSAAHKTLPLPCYARVTNMKNGHSVIVRVNDRGPFRPGRVVDLSGRAAELLGFHKSGVAPVRVEYVGLAPLAEGVRKRPAATSQAWSAQYADAGLSPPSEGAASSDRYTSSGKGRKAGRGVLLATGAGLH